MVLSRVWRGEDGPTDLGKAPCGIGSLDGSGCMVCSKADVVDTGIEKLNTLPTPLRERT